MFTRLFDIIARKSGIGYQSYADGTQLYVSLDLAKEHCHADFRLRMPPNLLNFDDDKTDIICMVSSHYGQSVETLANLVLFLVAQ